MENIIIPRSNLELLSMHELSVVMDGATLARDVIMGVCNQPRCQGAAHTELDELKNSFNFLVEVIADVADKAKPKTVAEATIRAYIIIHHETTYEDQFSEVLASAQFLQRDIEAVQARTGGAA